MTSLIGWTTLICSALVLAFALLRGRELASLPVFVYLASIAIFHQYAKTTGVDTFIVVCCGVALIDFCANWYFSYKRMKFCATLCGVCCLYSGAVIIEDWLGGNALYELYPWVRAAAGVMLLANGGFNARRTRNNSNSRDSGFLSRLNLHRGKKRGEEV